MDQSNSKIDNTTASLMVATAVFFDVLSIVPVLNWFSTFFAFMTFGVWFMIKGVGLISPKKIAAPIISVIIELIPAISAIPSITLMIIVTISVIKAEEKGLSPGAIIDSNVVNVARKKAGGVNKPNVITPSIKSVVGNEKIRTKELTERTV